MHYTTELGYTCSWPFLYLWLSDICNEWQMENIWFLLWLSIFFSCFKNKSEVKYLALIRDFTYLQVSCQDALEKQNRSLGQCTGKKSLVNLNHQWKTWLKKHRLHYSSICNHIQPLSLQVSSSKSPHCMGITLRWGIYHVFLTEDQMLWKFCDKTGGLNEVR